MEGFDELRPKVACTAFSIFNPVVVTGSLPVWDLQVEVAISQIFPLVYKRQN